MPYDDPRPLPFPKSKQPHHKVEFTDWKGGRGSLDCDPESKTNKISKSHLGLGLGWGLCIDLMLKFYAIQSCFRLTLFVPLAEQERTIISTPNPPVGISHIH